MWSLRYVDCVNKQVEVHAPLLSLLPPKGMTTDHPRDGHEWLEWKEQTWITFNVHYNDMHKWWQCHIPKSKPLWLYWPIRCMDGGRNARVPSNRHVYFLRTTWQRLDYQSNSAILLMDKMLLRAKGCVRCLRDKACSRLNTKYLHASIHTYTLHYNLHTTTNSGSK